MPTASFSVKLELGKPEVVTLNGLQLDPTLFRFVGVRSEDGKLPVLLLEVSGEGTIEGDGVVVMRREPDELGALREWVASLDPQEINRLSLLHSPNLGVSPGEGLKAALMELVNG